MTGRFLVDEDMPRSLARALRAAGHDAEDVRDVGLRGRPDAEIFAYATGHDRAVVTADLGFANLRTYPLGSHGSIFVARFPNETPVADLVAAIVRAVDGLSDDEATGALVMIEPHRIRIRVRPPAAR